MTINSNITTFAQLIKYPEINKTILIEILLKDSLINREWIDHDGADGEGGSITIQPNVKQLNNYVKHEVINLTSKNTDTTNTLITNGGFNSDVHGWSTSSGSSVAGGVSGNALELKNNDDTQNESAEQGVGVEGGIISVRPNTQYLFTAYHKSGTTISGEIKILDAEINPPPFIKQIILGSDASWTKYTHIFITGNNTTKLRIILQGFDHVLGRTSFFDDISIVPTSIIRNNTINFKLPIELETMVVDGVALTQRTSVVAVNDNSNSFYHSQTQEKIFINTSTALTSLSSLIGKFKLRLASKSIELNSKMYYGYLKSIPNTSIKSEQIFQGYSATARGLVSLINADGFFDKIIEKYLWVNSEINILLGRESLPYSEYQQLFKGVIKSQQWTRKTLSLNIESVQNALTRTITLKELNTNGYPNLPDENKGALLPFVYGIFTGGPINAPTAIVVDKGTTGVQGFGTTDAPRFILVGDPIKSIETVWIKYPREPNRWQTAALDNDVPMGNTYRVLSLTASSFQIGMNSVADYLTFQKDISSTKVRVAFTSQKDSNGDVINQAVPIIKSLLTTHSIFATGANLFMTTFNQSAIDATFPLIIYQKTDFKIINMINKIALGDLAYFNVTKEDKFSYVLWSPSNIMQEIFDENEFSKITTKFNAEQQFNKVRVGYSQSPNTDLYAFTTGQILQTQYDYGIDKTKTIRTFLSRNSDASSLAELLALMIRKPAEEISLEASWNLSEKNIGDVIRLTLERSTESTFGSYFKKPVEIKSIAKDFVKGIVAIVCDDFKGLSDIIGLWATSDAPNYADSSQADKANSGYWATADGCVVAGDNATKNISIWMR